MKTKLWVKLAVIVFLFLLAAVGLKSFPEAEERGRVSVLMANSGTDTCRSLSGVAQTGPGVTMGSGEIIYASGYLDFDALAKDSTASRDDLACVTDSGKIKGFAWDSNFGLVQFNSEKAGDANKTVFDFSTGKWSKYAWNNNIGWIWFNWNCDYILSKLNSSLAASCTDLEALYQPVRTDLSTGKVTGYAWNDHLGWINFTGISQQLPFLQVGLEVSITPDPNLLALSEVPFSSGSDSEVYTIKIRLYDVSTGATLKRKDGYQASITLKSEGIIYLDQIDQTGNAISSDPFTYFSTETEEYYLAKIKSYAPSSNTNGFDQEGDGVIDFYYDGSSTTNHFSVTGFEVSWLKTPPRSVVIAEVKEANGSAWSSRELKFRPAVEVNSLNYLAESLAVDYLPVLIDTVYNFEGQVAAHELIYSGQTSVPVAVTSELSVDSVSSNDDYRFVFTAPCRENVIGCSEIESTFNFSSTGEYSLSSGSAGDNPLSAQIIFVSGADQAGANSPAYRTVVSYEVPAQRAESSLKEARYYSNYLPRGTEPAEEGGGGGGVSGDSGGEGGGGGAISGTEDRVEVVPLKIDGTIAIFGETEGLVIGELDFEYLEVWEDIKKKFRDTVYRNAADFIRGFTCDSGGDPGGGEVTGSTLEGFWDSGCNGESEDGKILYFTGDVRMYNTECESGEGRGAICERLEEPKTIVVIGGDLYLEDNWPDSNERLGLVVLRDFITHEGGNIYFTPNVTDFFGNIYADGSLMSVKEYGAVDDWGVPIWSSMEERESALINQLYLEGSMYVFNTIGESNTELSQSYAVSGQCLSPDKESLMDCDEAKHYDLMKLRYFTVCYVDSNDPEAGTTDCEGMTRSEGLTTEENSAVYLKYNPPTCDDLPIFCEDY